MRRIFADTLHRKMRKNRDIWVVTGDLGYKMWDPIKKDYPGRYLNVGAAEQLMVGAVLARFAALRDICASMKRV